MCCSVCMGPTHQRETQKPTSLTSCAANGTLTIDTAVSCTAAGGLVGSADGGSFNSCSVTGTIQAPNLTDTSYAGGFLGQEIVSESQATYSDCSAAVEMAVGSAKAGKFVGYVYNGQFTNCTAKNTDNAMEFLKDIHAVSQEFTDPLYTSKTHQEESVTVESATQGEYQDFLLEGSPVSYTSFLATLNSCTYESPAETAEGQEPSYQKYQQVIAEKSDAKKYYKLDNETEIWPVALMTGQKVDPGTYLIVHAQTAEDGTVSRKAMAADGSSFAVLDNFDPAAFTKESAGHALWSFNSRSIQSSKGQYLNCTVNIRDHTCTLTLGSTNQTTWTLSFDGVEKYQIKYKPYISTWFLSYDGSSFTVSKDAASMELYQVTSKTVWQGTFTRAARSYSCFSQLMGTTQETVQEAVQEAAQETTQEATQETAQEATQEVIYETETTPVPAQ